MFVCLRNIPRLFKRHIRIKNRLVVEFLAEIVGTFILVGYGLGSVAQFKLSKQDNPYAYSFISLSFANGLAISCGILVVGKVSGFKAQTSVDTVLE